MKANQEKARHNHTTLEVAPIVSETMYAPFDTDAVRPTHIDPA